MARPLKKPSERRRHVVNLRMTDAEFEEFKRLARDAGVTAGRYIRETVLGRRPKARPQQLLVFQELVRQLQYIATNFRQLATATGDDRYAPWARYMGADFVGHILDKDDLSDVVEPQLDALNTAGQQVNTLARKANSEIAFKASERSAAFTSLKRALEPIRQALQNKNKKPVLDYPAEA
ncbi:MAG: hypothetical protein IT566_10625 [Rhodospirillaceae bacterium]|nr:hypothetical protein [Rhodospirillaceae bacterium]